MTLDARVGCPASGVGRESVKRLLDRDGAAELAVGVQGLLAELIFSFFKTLTGQPITIELKNDVAITGTLKSVDQFLNFRIENLRVVGNESVERAMLEGGAGGEVDAEKARWPHLLALKSAFIRGSVVRYVHVPAGAVDTQLLEDATRREASSGKK
ncbi:Sm-like ribonucleo protein [Microstroma glucosiphilum]|uniref:Sm-like ribonucleo protein n=1 Tax=Pseudomicrostroma glucosiphilum TaxID=1684307 RepID=A0A316UEZ9_9BASI|nr:Sm-like ribonucleo protein [Pseudomicrostroma glucosiphilum]PWN21705.1 Sm-like ribonucleo protein [Pseudomicrostroma glucosiphilum]